MSDELSPRMQAIALGLFDRVRAWTASVDGVGVTRASYGSGESAALDEVARCARELGLTDRIDPAGNLWLTGPDGWPAEPPIVVGSHLDSVPRGGNYDGLAGVVAAVLVLAWARSADSRLPLVGLGLRGEESAWFGVPHLGSRALLGRLTPAVLARRREDGVVLADAMRDAGADVGRISHGERLLPAVREFWELHIEQGPVLAARGVPVGVVDAIRGSVRAPSARMLGRAGHSGTTPHEMREDAVLRLAELLVATDRRRRERQEAGEDLVVTCGVVGTVPGRHSITTIADEVRFSLDVRSTSDDVAARAIDAAADLVGGTVDWGEVVRTPSVRLDPQLISRARSAAAALGGPLPRVAQRRRPRRGGVRGSERALGDDLRPQRGREPQSRRVHGGRGPPRRRPRASPRDRGRGRDDAQVSVYVDASVYGYGRMVMCHMIADNPQELHAMADRIGVARRWFQAPPGASFWHYDVAKSKRALAVEHGAVECDRAAFVAAMRRIRSSGAFG